MHNDLTNKKIYLLSLGLMILAAVILVWTLVRVASAILTAKGDPEITSELIAQNQSDPNRVKEHLAHYQECADALQKKNLFSEPPKPPQPPKQCTAILGDEAFIDGKWVKVGDTVGAGAKIVAIEAARVKLDWNGKEIILAPIKIASSGRSGPSRSHSPAPPRQEKVKIHSPENHKPQPSEPPPVAQEQPVQEDDPLAWLGVDIPASVRDKIIQMLDSMPDEQKEKFKEQWAKMPQEQKQQAVDAWSQHLQ